MQRISLVLAGITLVGCSDSTGLSPEALDGRWTAVEVTASNAIDPSQQIDLTALGFSLSLEFRANGQFTLTIADVFGNTDSTSGTFDVVGSDITLTAEGTDVTLSAERDGDVLTVNWSEIDIDWDEDGTPDLTVFRVVMRRA